jgi:hypothetical protein
VVCLNVRSIALVVHHPSLTLELVARLMLATPLPGAAETEKVLSALLITTLIPAGALHLPLNVHLELLGMIATPMVPPLHVLAGTAIQPLAAPLPVFATRAWCCALMV